MSLLKTLGGVSKAAIGIVTLPVSAVADIVTMAGFLADRDSYTVENASDIMENLKRAVEPD